MIDFVDDMREGQGYYADNYLYRHGKERQSIYKKSRFPCKVFQVDLRNNNVNANISEYSDERLENIQEGIEEQKINAQKARSEYLSSLAGY